jgi:hypothetical protein
MARKARPVGLFGRIVRWVVVAALMVGVLAAAIVYRELASDLPPVDQLLRYQPPTATRVFADDGTPSPCTCGSRFSAPRTPTSTGIAASTR